MNDNQNNNLFTQNNQNNINNINGTSNTSVQQNFVEQPVQQIQLNTIEEQVPQNNNDVRIQTSIETSPQAIKRNNKKIIIIIIALLIICIIAFFIIKAFKSSSKNNNSNNIFEKNKTIETTGKKCLLSDLIKIDDNTYEDNYYIYKYKQESKPGTGEWKGIEADGYGVKLKDSIQTSVIEITEEPCSVINNKPIVSTAYMFNGAQNLQSIKLDTFDVSKVINMEGMFKNCSELEDINITNWNTSSVIDMSGMFSQMGNFSDYFFIDLSNWDTSSVTDMGDMFYLSGNLYRDASWNVGDLSKWDTSNVTNMSSMFKSAGTKSKEFNIGDISKWDTSKVTNMSSMFNNTGINALYDYDLSKWNVDNVKDYSNFTSSYTKTKITEPKWVK